MKYLLIISVLLIGCKKPQIIESKTIERIVKDSTILTKEFNIERVLWLDTLKINKMYEYQDSTQKMHLKLIKNEFGRLRIMAQKDKDTIIVKTENTIIHEKTTQIKEVEKIPYWFKVIGWIEAIIICMLLVLALFLAVKK